MKRIKYLEYLPIIIIAMLIYLLVSNLSIFSALWRIVSPIVFGVAIAYLLNPMATAIHRRLKISWGWCIFIVIVLLLALIALLIVVIVPVVIENVSEFVTTGIPNIMRNLSQWVTDLEDYIRTKTSYGEALDYVDISSIIGRISSASTDWLKFFSGKLYGITAGLMKFIIALIISIYLLFLKTRYTLLLHRFVRVFLKEDHQRNFYRVAYKADHYFSKFLIGKMIDSAIIGVICFIGMTLLKLPYPMIISIFVGITNIIPYFGPFIGAVPGIVIILLIKPVSVIWFIIFIIALQQFDGYILGPKILGDSIGVSPLWIIIGVLLGGGLMGPIGMIIGVPLVALINSEISYIMDEREKKLDGKLPDKSFL